MQKTYNNKTRNSIVAFPGFCSAYDLAENSQLEEAVELSQKNHYHHYRSDKLDAEIVEFLGFELSAV